MSSELKRITRDVLLGVSIAGAALLVRALRYTRLSRWASPKQRVVSGVVVAMYITELIVRRLHS